LLPSCRLLLTIAVSLDFKNDSMMHEPINRSDRHHGIGKDRVPLAEGLIGGDE